MNVKGKDETGNLWDTNLAPCVPSGTQTSCSNPIGGAYGGASLCILCPKSPNLKRLSKQFIANNHYTKMCYSSADEKFKTTSFKSPHFFKNVDSVSFSVRYSCCHDLMMAKAKKLSL
ncbi:hypothetical protein ILYODFUR_038883 [Ilyodon furcidens]|uniref:Uncharacterized protein n=1 Tax=Ilyodon furcidens TaxID=33524 RepID=A0ABV0UZV0_9TELE